MSTEIVETLQHVRNNLEAANARYKNIANLNKRPKVFNEGDLVMVHLQNVHFSASEYHRFQAKKFGPFSVKKRINDLPSIWIISDTFNVADIHKYHPPNAVSSSSSKLEVELFLSGGD